MRTSKGLLACLLILAVFMLDGCKSKKDAQSEANSKSSEPNAVVRVATVESPKVAPVVEVTEARVPVLVTVNGIDITENQIKQRFEAQLDDVRRQMPPEFFKQYKEAMREKLLDEMMVDVILDAKVRESNIAVTDEEVAAHVTQIADGYNMPVEELKAMLKAQGRDFNEFKEDLRKRLGHEKFLESQLAGLVSVTEDQAKQYYSENAEQFHSAEGTDFEQVKDDVMQRLYKDREKEALRRFIEQLKAEANIVYAGEQNKGQ